MPSRHVKGKGMTHWPAAALSNATNCDWRNFLFDMTFRVEGKGRQEVRREREREGRERALRDVGVHPLSLQVCARRVFEQVERCTAGVNGS